MASYIFSPVNENILDSRLKNRTVLRVIMIKKSLSASMRDCIAIMTSQSTLQYFIEGKQGMNQ